VILFVYYGQTHQPAPHPADRIYPDFIWRFLPPGAAGLVIAAILAAAMSNLSAALNSLASTTIMDFYKPLTARRNPAPGEAHFLGLARWATVAWGVVLFGIGLLARRWGSVLEAGLSIASVLYGSLLGVFLLGLLTKRVREGAAMGGMLAGLAAIVSVKLFTTVAWTWYVLIGTCVTFLAGCLCSLAERRKENA
jgi:Na+/proline symporter